MAQVLDFSTPYDRRGLFAVLAHWAGGFGRGNAHDICASRWPVRLRHIIALLPLLSISMMACACQKRVK